MRGILIILVIMFGLGTTAKAQENRESVIKAYERYAESGDYEKAVETGTNAVFMLYSTNNYREAFEMCRNISQLIFTEEQKSGKPLHEQRFLVTRERLNMYIRLRNVEQAQLQLNNMEKTTSESGSAKLSDMLFYAKANFCYSFGKVDEGDKLLEKAIESHKAKGEFEKVDNYYHEIITAVKQSGNTNLMDHVYGRFMEWQDEKNNLISEERMRELQGKYDESLKSIDERDSQISTKQYVIVGMATLIVALIAVIAVIAIMLTRLLMGNKRLKGVISTLKENGERQAGFISSISRQLEPTINELRSSAERMRSTNTKEADELIERIDAISGFTQRIEELSSLEGSIGEPFDIAPFNSVKFCQGIINEAKTKIRPGVELHTDIASIEMKSNAGQLERILTHLLDNAARHTSSGNIRLELKRKGAHVCQFVVADNGVGMSDEKKSNLFKPFNEAKDLREGDSLGLPICAMIATKLNGSLSVDMEYRKGCKFILTIGI